MCLNPPDMFPKTPKVRTNDSLVLRVVEITLYLNYTSLMLWRYHNVLHRAQKEVIIWVNASLRHTHSVNVPMLSPCHNHLRERLVRKTGCFC